MLRTIAKTTKSIYKEKANKLIDKQMKIMTKNLNKLLMERLQNICILTVSLNKTEYLNRN
jgi:hypothetical protein